MNRKFDALGRISIPKEMRDKLGFDSETNEAHIEFMTDKIIITNPETFSIEKYIEERFEATDSRDMKMAYVDILEKIRGWK